MIHSFQVQMQQASVKLLDDLNTICGQFLKPNGSFITKCLVTWFKIISVLGLRLGKLSENIYGLYVSLSVVFYCYSCFWGLKLPILQVAFETSNGPFIFVNYKISIWEGIKIYRVILEEKGRYWVVLRPSVTLKTSKMSRVFNLGVNHEFKLVNHEYILCLRAKYLFI